MIVFAHLLNDFSGSPRVLKNVIDATLAVDKSSLLYIGTDGVGVLSNCGLPTKKYWYWRTGNKLGTLFTYFFSQLVLFFKLLSDRDIDRNAVIYVNTLLPFGAALYAKVTGRRVIYHVHEISITPAPLKWLLVGINRLTSSLNLYVSDAHIQALPIAGVPSKRIYNVLDTDFVSKSAASVYQHRRNGMFNILMIASLRDYKGIPELFLLASRCLSLSNVHFDLVVNDDEEAINDYCNHKQLPSNLKLHARVEDTVPFYANACLVLNLSRIDLWVETFGLTILEAMAFGLPVIVPPVGGPAEIVQHGVQGYLVDSRDGDSLFEAIKNMYENPDICKRFSKNCRLRSENFSYKEFINTIQKVINSIN